MAQTPICIRKEGVLAIHPYGCGGKHQSVMYRHSDSWFWTGEEATQAGSLELKARTELRSLCNGDCNHTNGSGEGSEGGEETETHRGTRQKVSSVEVIDRSLCWRLNGNNDLSSMNVVKD